MKIFTYQPFKALYIIHVFAKTFLVKLPLDFLYYGLTGRRTRPTWSLKKCLKVRITRNLSTILGATRVKMAGRDPTLQVAESSLKKSSFLWLPSISPELVQGIAKHHKIGPLPKIAAYAYPKGKTFDDGHGHVCLYLHGGGYISCSAHESSPIAPLIDRLVSCPQIGMIIVPEYRLALDEPHPAQLLDALAGYAHLINTLHVDPSRILVSGDSAGGNLSLMLVRYLRDTRVLPMPGKLLLFSPWTDMAILPHKRPNLGTDYLDTCGLHWAVFQVTRNTPEWGNDNVSPSSPYFSPCATEVPATPELFAGFPKTFIHYGEAEELIWDSQQLEKRLQVSGVDVTVMTLPDGVHDPFTQPGEAQEKSRQFKLIGEWIAS